MDKNKFSKSMMENMRALLAEMKKHPESVTEDDILNLKKLRKSLSSVLGISEHTEWTVHWKVDKWLDSARYREGFAPDEVCYDTQNLVVDTGANEILKLITDTGGTAFSNANAKLYVGSSNTAENAAQVALQAVADEQAYAAMDAGYPVVTGRQVVFRGTFEDDEANFEWQELGVKNGSAADSILLNRKVSDMGRKSMGVWVLQLTISVTNPPADTTTE